MTTKFIGMKEFRANIATYTKRAKELNVRFVIIKKNVPVLEVYPIDEKEFVLEKLKKDVAKAREQAMEGKVYTQKEILAEFGLS
ncbi:hypothetical protein HZA42_03200 [Candidatus Peregrinibacteria bacterium]|nr:hypothetical protein [Candidatus Peregrinibacteria bacterium]